MGGIAARRHCASGVASIFRLHEVIGAGNSMLLHEVLDRQIRRLACFERRRSRPHTIVRHELASVVFRCCLFRSQSGCVLLLFDLFQQLFPRVFGKLLLRRLDRLVIDIDRLAAVIGEASGRLADGGVLRPVVQTVRELFVCHDRIALSRRTHEAALCAEQNERMQDGLQIGGGSIGAAMARTESLGSKMQAIKRRDVVTMS
jgi:hypothetical protein